MKNRKIPMDDLMWHYVQITESFAQSVSDGVYTEKNTIAIFADNDFAYDDPPVKFDVGYIMLHGTDYPFVIVMGSGQ